MTGIRNNFRSEFRRFRQPSPNDFVGHARYSWLCCCRRPTRAPKCESNEKGPTEERDSYKPPHHNDLTPIKAELKYLCFTVTSHLLNRTGKSTGPVELVTC